jgi:hypothetical protein
MLFARGVTSCVAASRLLLVACRAFPLQLLTLPRCACFSSRVSFVSNVASVSRRQHELSLSLLALASLNKQIRAVQLLP